MNEATTNSPKSLQQSEMGVSTINFLIGVWVFISPFVLIAFRDLQNARTNNFGVGILIAIVALIRMSNAAKASWSWANVVLGVWLLISPFVLGFANTTVAMWSNVISGIVLGILAWTRPRFPRQAHHTP